MSGAGATTIVLNASLLLALAVVFELATAWGEARRTAIRSVASGLAIAVIGVCLMLVPAHFENGVQFDTRSVLLCTSGLFLGSLPTIVSALVLAAFRVAIGGAGVWMGLSVIAMSAGLGIAWRRLRKGPVSEISAKELFALGLVVHAAMVGLMYILPRGLAFRALETAAPTVLIVYPAVTVLLGLLLRERLRARQVEADLRKSEAQFRLIAEHAVDMIYRYELSPEPRFTYVSPSATRLTGYSPEEHYANPNLGLQIVHPDDRPKLEAAARGELPPGGALVLRWVRKDGTMLWSEQRNRTLLGPDGAPVAIEGVARDITDRMQAFERARAAEANYRHLFEANPQPMWVCELGTRALLAVNDAAVAHYGYSREELLTMRSCDLEAPGAPPLPEPEDPSADLHRHTRHVKRSGEVIDVEIHAHTLDFQGRVARLVLVTDVTQQHRAERERERLIAAIEHAGESIVITDPEGKIEYVNPAFERVSGYSRAEVRGKNPRILKSGRQDAEFYRQLWATLVEGRPWRGRMVNQRRDGSFYTEEVTISPVLGGDGALMSYVAVKRDITDELRLQEEYLQAQKMETVGRLAGGVAHDFNNLLTVINGTAALAIEGTPTDSLVRTDLQEILAAGERAAVLTRQLLAFSRKQVVAPKTLDVVAVVEGVRKMLQRLIGEDVQLFVHTSVDRAHVRADSGQLEQVLVNLAVNARDAMEGGGRLTIETAVVDVEPELAARTMPPIAPGRWVRLSVIDTGPGMDDALQRKIFEPFFTTKRAGKGTGLGLSTVLSIVRQSHGGIGLTSAPGHGARFDVYLPLVAMKAPTLDLTGPLAKPTAGREGVLIVDDEDGVRGIAARVLSDAGYAVCVAPGGVEALRVLADPSIELDLLVTDVVMPVMNGRELSEAAVQLRPELRVLFTSGYTGDVALLDWVYRSGGPFLAKPYGPADLLKKVRELLDAAPVGPDAPEAPAAPEAPEHRL
ncbi:PAS domain S-box protein [Myxococcota bacterium]|nr:PAS domain S-box protein [Myxococcota bacterium]